MAYAGKIGGISRNGAGRKGNITSATREIEGGGSRGTKSVYDSNIIDEQIGMYLLLDSLLNKKIIF